MEPVPVSSTEIRQRVKNGEEIAGLVPPAVETYIREKNLFRR
jgi:nicotinic acid mononucleotide adenylyltransferase